MQLIAIGEGVKQVDRLTEGILLSHHPSVNWKRVMGMRDILSHHYFDVDAEIVYIVCSEHTETLENELSNVLGEIPEPSGPAARTTGSAKGDFVVPDDFDDPLSDDVLNDFGL